MSITDLGVPWVKGTFRDMHTASKVQTPKLLTFSRSLSGQVVIKNMTTSKTAQDHEGSSHIFYANRLVEEEKLSFSLLCFPLQTVSQKKDVIDVLVKQMLGLGMLSTQVSVTLTSTIFVVFVAGERCLQSVHVFVAYEDYTSDLACPCQSINLSCPHVSAKWKYITELFANVSLMHLSQNSYGQKKHHI